MISVVWVNQPFVQTWLYLFTVRLFIFLIPLPCFPQIGRSTESMIDFVVTDTAGSSSGQGGGAAGEGGGGGQSAQSTISRYACRIMCERSAPYTARIYAAGFDSSKNIFLGVSVLPRGCQASPGELHMDW